MSLRFREAIEVKQNLKITIRERGKIVARREGHNIWLNLGREYLSQLIAATSFGPVVPERNDRVQYMGLGIGGTRQLALTVANSPPISVSYPGTNAQDDVTATETILERPVRLSGSAATYPGLGTDVWLGQIVAPATHPIATQTLFSRLFSTTEVSYDTFLTVPLSEIGLFTSAANPNVFNNTMIAYDTFDTISKTVAFQLEVDWTIRF